MAEAHHRRRAIYQVLFATLWLTLLVLAVKVWAGWATRSLSLLAESLHTLIDSFSILLSLTAVASPYRVSWEIWSHDRRKTAGVLLLVAFLGYAGLSLLGSAVQRLEFITHSNMEAATSPQISLPLIQLLGVVIAINLCMTVFERYESRVLDSAALRLNANHMLRDAWLTLLVLVGLVGVWQGYIWLDPLMAIVLVLMSVKSGWRVLNWQIPLMVKQVAIAPEALAQIATQVEGVTHCTRIRSQGIVGRHVLVELHLVLHPEFLGSSRPIAERVEGAIRERYGPVQAIIYVKGDQSDPDQRLDSVHWKDTTYRKGEPDWN